MCNIKMKSQINIKILLQYSLDFLPLPKTSYSYQNILLSFNTKRCGLIQGKERCVNINII